MFIEVCLLKYVYWDAYIEVRIRKNMYQMDLSARTIVCTYSIYKEAPEDGPLRSETCTADT